MKTLSLLSALLLSVSINAYANGAQDNHQSAQALQVADASQVSQGVNNAKKLRFNSRRPALNQAVKNKKSYNGEDEWVAVGYKDSKASKAGQRLNRQFRSKRPHINYQFD